MGEIAELWASLGARVNEGQWRRADTVLTSAQRRLDALGERSARGARRGLDATGAAAERAGARTASVFGGVGRLVAAGAAVFGGRALYGGLIKFNSGVQDSRNQIAGMLSLAKKTDLADQFGAADTLIANLQKRAATLPGTTADYIAMLSNLAQPVSDAGLSMQALEDITVGASVAARALGINAEVAARDIDQALRGQFHSVDQFTGKLLGAAGFKGEEGRARFNALTQAQRAAKVQEVITSKQITQLAEAQGKTFSGVLSTLEDAIQQFAGRVGKPLFEALAAAVANLNAWLEQNEQTVRAVADAVGVALVAAFESVGAAVEFFSEHMELTKSILIAVGIVLTAFAVQAAAAWLAAFWPVALAVAAIAAVVYAIRNFSKTTLAVLGVIFAPITAVVAAIYGIVQAVRNAGAIWQWLKGTAGSVWDAFRAFGSRVIRFFTDDVPSAIKGALTAAFDFIRGLPVVRAIIAAIDWVRSHTGATETGSIATEASKANQQALLQTGPGGLFMRSQAAITAPPAAGAVAIGTVDVGGITVNPSSGDPKAVAAEVRAAFDARLGEHLRITKDAL